MRVICGWYEGDMYVICAASWAHNVLQSRAQTQYLTNALRYCCFVKLFRKLTWQNARSEHSCQVLFLLRVVLGTETWQIPLDFSICQANLAIWLDRMHATGKVVKFYSFLGSFSELKLDRFALFFQFVKPSVGISPSCLSFEVLDIEFDKHNVGIRPSCLPFEVLDIEFDKHNVGISPSCLSFEVLNIEFDKHNVGIRPSCLTNSPFTSRFDKPFRSTCRYS